jgi:hypothetical protein
MKKMTSEIALCRDHWKYGSKISLPQIALHRYWNCNFTVQATQAMCDNLRCICMSLWLLPNPNGPFLAE